MSDLCPKCGISVRKCLNTDACEARALRAQLAAVTRERDDWARDFGEKADRLLEVMRERDEARAFAADREGLAVELEAARETIQHGIELRKQVERERNEAHNELCLARDMARARVSAILQTIGGEAEGRPTSEVNFLQRLRELVQWEKAHLEAVKVIRELMLQRDAARESEARMRAALEGLLPSPTSTKPNVVERHLCIGRMWLRVAGAYVAIEGSQCFDEDFGVDVHEVRRWTGEDFKRIEERFAEPIRAALSAPAPEPSELMMRVAEAVQEACFCIVDYGEGGRDGVLQSLRALDLRAIVAKVTP